MDAKFLAVGAAALFLILSACERGSSNLEPPTKVEATSHAASGVESPYAAIIPADAQATKVAGRGSGVAGAETSPSKSAGPGNGSTAVGGESGGQATGVTKGGAPAPTAGDGQQAASGSGH